MCEDAVTASTLLKSIGQAGADTVLVVNGAEALCRLKQFQFAAAALAWQGQIEAVAEALRRSGVPFLIFGKPPAGAIPEALVPYVADLAVVVPTLEKLLA